MSKVDVSSPDGQQVSGAGEELQCSPQQDFRQVADGPCCMAPPHPDLKKRMDAQRAAQARTNKRAVAAPEGIAEPRHLGFNDGMILPRTAFAAGTSVAKVKSAASDRAPLRGTVRVAVVLVDFSDAVMTRSNAELEQLFFSTGAVPTGSVREYYSEVTNGLISLAGAVVGPYRMPHTRAWYANGNYGIGKGPGDVRAQQLARDAVAAADADVDFGPYDNDGNGYVDAFVVVHAGAGGEVTGDSSDIWSHKWTLSSPYATDGTNVFGYLTVPEDSKIGVCAHELGHLLFGFPDLYDADYTSEGIGDWCLMAGGTWNGGGDVPAHPSAWCKANQGWVTVTNITSNGGVNIPDVKTARSVLRVWTAGALGGEYFLLENRQQTLFDRDLPGAGLLVWHIDESIDSNTDESHYKVALLQADGQRDLELNQNRGDRGDPYPGSSAVSVASAATSPNTNAYSGTPTQVVVDEISAPGPTMTARIAIASGPRANRAKRLVVGSNQDKRLEVFSIAPDDSLRHNWQVAPNSGWSGESALGGAARQLATAQNADGRLEVFYVGTNDALYHNWQVAPNSGWSGESALGGAAKQVVCARNADGRLEIFYVGTNDALYHNWQVAPNGGWKGESALGGAAKQLVVAEDADGRLEVFYVGTNDVIYHKWQLVPNGGWSDEVALGGSARQVAVSRNADGRLEIFYIGLDSSIYHRWQVLPNAGWSAASALGGSAKQIAAARNADGRLEVFYIGTDDALYHNWQSAPNSGWQGQAALAGSAKQLTVASNADGRLELFYVGTDDALYHNWQLVPSGGWSGESRL